MSKKIPLPTPGGILEREFLEPLNLTGGALAARLGVTRTAISQILKGDRAISVDMAFRLGKCFGNTPQFWLNLQQQYEIRKAQSDSKLKAKVKAIEPVTV